MMSLMFALLAAAAVASACVTPPCLAFNGYASWREFVVNRTCCQLCSPGHSCDGRVSTPCNISAGEYQPEAAQLKCLKAAVCDVGTWENVPTSPTSSRRCTPISTCDPLSQVETRQPTSTSDRICTCIDGWAGISQCFPCASLSVGCTTCNLSIASNSSTRVTCSDCIDGYSLDVTAGECIPCTVRDCLRCIAPGVCSKCIDGKRPVLGECACEDSRCAECTNESHCLRCTEPYVLSPITGKCNECTGEMVMVNGTCVAKSQTSTAASNNKSGSVSIYVVAGIVIAVAGGCLVLLLAVYKSVIKPRIAGRTAPVPPPRVATNAEYGADEEEFMLHTRTMLQPTYVAPEPVYATIGDGPTTSESTAAKAPDDLGMYDLASDSNPLYDDRTTTDGENNDGEYMVTE